MNRAPVHGAPGKIRIIGGQWRGRRLPVPPVEAVRPTADRVRETLFNWLAPRLPGARCLDLFAGTGVLGFEALSRGAAAVTLVDSDPRVLRHLEDVRALLGAENSEVLGYDARAWLAQREPAPYDIIFVDPPFAAGLDEQILALLAQHWVAASGVVYLETPAPPHIGPAWTCLKQGRTRQVVYTLLAPTPASASANGEISSG